jgi:hypothetical protein
MQPYRTFTRPKFETTKFFTYKNSSRMKKAILFFVFLFVASLATSNAQCAASAGAQKSCCASKVAKAASADPSIEKRMADNGAVSYVRKETDAQGNVKFVSVQFDETNNAFVNVAPKTMTADTKEAGMVKKSCATGSAAGKACAGGAAKAGCCKSGEAKTCADKKLEQ